LIEKAMAHAFRIILRSPIGKLLMLIAQRFYPKEFPGWVVVEDVHLELPHLDPEFDGYRVVQISDFHIGTWVTRKHLDEVVELVNEQQPDLVVLTGDYVTFTPEKFASDLVSALKRIIARDGVLGILGNHDHWTDPKVIRRVFYAAGVTDLSNRVYSVHRRNSALHFGGVDDIMNELDCLEDVLVKLPSHGAAVLLVHEPDFADVSSRSGRFDLQISGHTHGGQVLLPLVGAIFLPSYGRKYPHGHYRVNGMHLYTNRGIGTAEVPVRYNCPAEITVFHLKSAHNGKS
jgi:predicted MPP superfamily phosphohydrolase